MIPEVQTLTTICLYALPVWLLLRGLWLLLHRRRPHLPRELLMCLFAVFMTSVLCMALDGAWASPQAMLQSALERLQTGRKIHLRPFQTIGPQLRTINTLTSFTQLLGNTLLFAPWGFCLPLLWRRFRTPLRMIGMSLLLTCFIEFTQLFIDRFLELDDILLNFLGSMLGAAAWRCIHRRWPQMDQLFLS